MTVAEERAQHRRPAGVTKRESSGRSPLTLIDVQTLDADPTSDTDWWIVEQPAGERLRAFTHTVQDAEPTAASSFTAPISFSGTVSEGWIESITPAEIVWHTQKGAGGAVALKRGWDAITRRLSGGVFGDEDLSMLRLHELALLSASIDGAPLRAKAREVELVSAGEEPKPKLKLASLEKRRRRVSAGSRLAAERATALVSDGEE